MAKGDPRTERQGVADDAMEAVEAWVRARVVELESRNASLKNQVRLLGVGLLAAFGAMAALTWMARTEASRAQPEVIETSALILRDAQGIARAELSLGEDGGPVLALRDRTAVDRLRLTVLGEGSPGMAFRDSEGKQRIVLALLPNEATTMGFSDRTGTMRAMLGVSEDNRSNIVFADRGGVPRVGLGVDALGTATVMLPQEAPRDSTSDGGSPPGVDP